jgi:hypothetical protein
MLAQRTERGMKSSKGYEEGCVKRERNEEGMRRCKEDEIFYGTGVYVSIFSQNAVLKTHD